MSEQIRVETRNLNLSFGPAKILKNLNIHIKSNYVTAIMGPSGCGKSTFIRTLNRLNDLIPECRIEGEVLLDGINILDKKIDVVELRKKIGMVFQKPNPFPKSIYDNIAYGPRIHGINSQSIPSQSWTTVGGWFLGLEKRPPGTLFDFLLAGMSPPRPVPIYSRRWHEVD